MRPIPVLAIIALDQLTKFLIGKFMSLDQSIPVLGGFFRLTLVHNRGAAFGILKNQTPIFIGTSIIAVALIYIDLKKHKSGKPSLYNIALNLILAGALGNLIDRVIFGYVIDFLDFRIWPVFNIADSAITIGALLLGYSILRQEGREVCTP